MKILKWISHPLRRSRRHRQARRRKAGNFPELSVLDGCLYGLLAERGRLDIVQVGANDGATNDPLFRFVMENAAATRIVLIEPHADIIPVLRRNYAGHPAHAVLCNAVGPEGELEFFRIKPSHWKGYVPKSHPEHTLSRFSSFDRAHVERLARDRLGDAVDPSEAVEAVRVASRPLDVLLGQQHLFATPDFLQVDTEGFDDQVLFAASLETLRPRLINYEHENLSAAAAEALRRHLEALGYRLLQWSEGDSLAIALDRRPA